MKHRLESISRHLIARFRTVKPIEVFVIAAVGFSVIFLTKYFSLNRQSRTIRVEEIGRDWANSFNPYGYKAPFWISNKLKTGQREKSSTGKTIAEVIDIENYERGNEEAVIYLTVKVEAQFNKKMETYVFKGRALDLGAPIELRLDNIRVLGQIIDENILTSSYEKKEIIIKGRWRAQEPWNIAQIDIGDTMVNRANGEVIAEILDVKIEPLNGASTILTLPSRTREELLLENNPRWRDAVISARIKVHKQNNLWFFAGHQKIKVGERIWIYTDKIDIGFLEINQVSDAVFNE